MFKTPIRLQASSSDCSAACLGIILEYFGFFHSIFELRSFCGVGQTGATVAQVQKGTEALGHKCRIFKKGLNSLKKLETPVILHWNLEHFVVLEGIRGNTIKINDPAYGRRSLTVSEFDKRYTGICLEVIPNEQGSSKARPSGWKILCDLVPNARAALKLALLIGMISSVVLFLMEVFFGGIIRTFFDYVIEHQMVHWGYITAAAGGILIGTRFLVRYIQKRYVEAISIQISTDTKSEYLSNLTEKSADFFEQHFAGELYSRLKDMDRCIRFFYGMLFNVSWQCVLALLISLAIYLVAPLILYVSIIPFIIMVVWQMLDRGKNGELDIAMREENTRYQAFQSRILNGYHRFFALGIQKHLLVNSVLAIARKQSLSIKMGRQKSTFTAFKNLVQATHINVMAFAGIYLMIEGQMSYGDFMFSSLLSVLLMTQLKDILNAVEQYVRLQPVVLNVAETIEYTNSPTGHLDEIMVDDAQETDVATINAEGLQYLVPGTDKVLFQNLSFEIYAGELVALIGDSGVGKTTLLEILAGIRAPDAGRVRYDGQPVSVDSALGFVFADDAYFSGSLVSILSGVNEADDKRLRSVLETVELWDRLGFLLYSDGSEDLSQLGLSRGEQQRLMLAQALYACDKCLLFDEAFSHISTEQSARILAKLRANGLTIIMATHRPELQEMCDRKIYFSK